MTYKRNKPTNHSDSGFKYHSHSRDPAQAWRRKWPDSELGKKNKKISPEYLVPKSYGRTEKKKMSKGHRCKLEGSFSIKAGAVPGKQ